MPEETAADAAATPAPRPVTPTLGDVARVAGVSVGTVSKVLNSRGRYSLQTRERVRSAANALNYLPNPQARSLHTGRTGTVGLLTNDLEGRFSLPVLMGVEDALGTDSISVFLCDARGDVFREQHHLRSLLAQRVDGLIIASAEAEPRSSLGQDLPVPVVYAYGHSMDAEDTSVVPDDAYAGHLGMSHLITLGRRRIGYVGGDSGFPAAGERARGAVQALVEAGLELVCPPLFGDWSERWGRQAIKLLQAQAPDLDAVMCGSDQIARGVLESLIRAGRKVPDEIAVLGHDNWEILAADSDPPLTSIDMNLELLGRRAAQLLFEAMAGDRTPGRHPVRGRLVIRESTI